MIDTRYMRLALCPLLVAMVPHVTIANWTIASNSRLTAAEKATADIASKFRFSDVAGRHIGEAWRHVPRHTLAEPLGGLGKAAGMGCRAGKAASLPDPSDAMVRRALSGSRAPNRGLGANPFKRQSPQQIDQMMRSKGFKPVGPDPASGKGSYLHPKTGRKYYVDKGGVYRKGVEGPHVDVHHMRDGMNLEDAKKKYFLDGDIENAN